MMNEITLILQAIDRGEKHASDDLLPLVYQELRRLASMKMHHESDGQTLQPTELVHEAWLRLTQNSNQTWKNRAHFLGAAAEAMRRILVERARRKQAVRHGGGLFRFDIEDLDQIAITPDNKVLLIDEALERLRMEDAEKARMVTLKFFGGLTNAEIATVMEIGERTVERQWAFAKAWLICSFQSKNGG